MNRPTPHVYRLICGPLSTHFTASVNSGIPSAVVCCVSRNALPKTADLIQPRGMTGRSSERRDVQWNNYIKGEPTGAKKTDEEKVEVKKN